MNIPKICIISVYFGKLPNYFSCWLLSCKYNTSINFIIFVDDYQIDQYNVPNNVTVIKSTLDNIKKLADEKLRLNCELMSPYKLCDFKPAYGLIFEDYLKEYDYWGHCDLDMMFGDLRYFFEQYEIDNYDKFSPLGHLSLYKNNFQNKNIFKKQVSNFSGYEKVFTDSRNYIFDEIMIPRIYYDNKINFFDKILFADIYDKLSRYTLVTNVNYYPEIKQYYVADNICKNYKYQLFFWEKGKTYRIYWNKGSLHKEEYMYIHVQKRKQKISVDEDTECILLSQNSYLSYDGYDIGLKEIKKYNGYCGIKENSEKICEFISHCWSFFKRKVIKVENSYIKLEKP